ncbi:MAG: DUF3179 domain-containing protein, partial [Cyanobacteria bacterium J083]
GGWENFKLKYFDLTSYFQAQNRELNDIRSQNANLTQSSPIKLTELLNGGPPKDGIPSIDQPKFDNAKTTPFKLEETVIGVVINGEAKAYPLGIMNWHEIVNDSLDRTNLTVSYCPLCDTIVVFERSNTTYGVSGKLYQSCLVMYDRSDDTLYSQPWAMGIVGKQVNQNLRRIPAVKTSLGNWLKKYPNSQILSIRTGYQRDYQNYSYGSYYTDKKIIFPVRNQANLTTYPKAIISYIWEADNQTPPDTFSGASRQFNHQKLAELKTQVLEFNGRKIKASWDEELATVIVTEMNGKIIPSSTAFAFVYPAYFNSNLKN